MKKTLFIMALFSILMTSCTEKKELLFSLNAITDNKEYAYKQISYTDYFPIWLDNARINYLNKKKLGVSRYGYMITKYPENGSESSYSEIRDQSVNPDWTGIGIEFKLPREVGRYKLSFLIKDEVVASRVFYVIDSEAKTAEAALKIADDIWEEFIINSDKDSNWYMLGKERVMYKNGILWKAGTEYLNAIALTKISDPLLSYKYARALQTLSPNKTNIAIYDHLVKALNGIQKDNKYYHYAYNRLGDYAASVADRYLSVDKKSDAIDWVQKSIDYRRKALECTDKAITEAEISEQKEIIGKSEKWLTENKK